MQRGFSSVSVGAILRRIPLFTHSNYGAIMMNVAQALAGMGIDVR